MKRKKSLIAIISLSAFLVIGGAVAYYNSTTNVDNKLKTGQFKSEVVEKFTPKDNWEPGDKVTKEVMYAQIPMLFYSLFEQLHKTKEYLHVAIPLEKTIYFHTKKTFYIICYMH